MDIDIDTTNGATIVRLTGRFDAHETAAARKVLDPLTDASEPHIELDLSGVGFIDSTALAELVRSMKRARESGGDLVLCAPTDAVRVILELTGLDRAFVVAA